MTETKKPGDFFAKIVEEVAAKRAELLETFIVAYLKLTGLSVLDIEIVERHDGTKIIWYCQKKGQVPTNLTDADPEIMQRVGWMRIPTQKFQIGAMVQSAFHPFRIMKVEHFDSPNDVYYCTWTEDGRRCANNYAEKSLIPHGEKP